MAYSVDESWIVYISDESSINIEVLMFQAVSTGCAVVCLRDLRALARFHETSADLEASMDLVAN